MCKEVGQLLMAWAKIWAEGRDETSLAAKKLEAHHKWMTELHCIHARHLANNITERANLAFEMRQNKDGVSVDHRPPLMADVDVFRWHALNSAGWAGGAVAACVYDRRWPRPS